MILGDVEYWPLLPYLDYVYEVGLVAKIPVSNLKDV